MLRFAALSIVALVVVGVVAVMVSQRVAEEEARSDAAGRAQSLAWGVAAPNVDRGVRLGRPRALERLGAALQQRIEEGTVAHVVLWDRDGRVIWADANWLIGESHQLSGGAAEAFTTMSSVAHLPDERSENEEGLYAGKDMLEVYVAARDLNDEPFVFEAYLSSDRIDQDRAAVLPRLLMVT
ncbi:MAG: hypothetical protein ACXWDM_12465, partial [Nocardioides sp.]